MKTRRQGCLALLRQILTTRSLHRGSHRPTKQLTEQAEVAFGKAEAARPRDHSLLWHSSDGLAVGYVAAPRKLPIVICYGQDLTQ